MIVIDVVDDLTELKEGDYCITKDDDIVLLTSKKKPTYSVRYEYDYRYISPYLYDAMRSTLTIRNISKIIRDSSLEDIEQHFPEYFV